MLNRSLLLMKDWRCICALRCFFAGLVIITRSSALVGSSSLSSVAASSRLVVLRDVLVATVLTEGVDANMASSGDTVRRTLVDG